MSLRDDELRCGDVLTELCEIPDESVHVICTSPPYYSQRDYDTGGQIGNEATVEEYIETLMEVFSECCRILRDDGSFILNIGDTYTNKERNMIPFRVASRLRENTDFLLRQDLVWEKAHPKPDPATDRRTNAHEYVFHLTKQRDYWYDETVCDGDHTSVITQPTATSQLDHVAVYSEDFVHAALTGITPWNVCTSCGTPYEREYDRIPRPFADPDRDHAQRAQELYEQSSLTEDHIEAIQAVGISDVGKATRTEDGAGRNTESIQQRASEAKEVLGGYYREFTMVERHPVGWSQQCDCEAETGCAVVCDPFVGSGTTAVVAQKLGCQYLGIDINEDYIATARERVGASH